MPDITTRPGDDDLPFEVHVVRHEPECRVDEGTCFTPWCRCQCHEPNDFPPLVAERPPMGWFGEHLGSHVWKNGAELVWECDDECPHPDHDDDHASVTWEVWS